MIRIIILCLVTKVMIAQWSFDPLINTPIAIQPNDQIDLRMEKAENGGAFIVWKDYRNGEPDIFIQKIDSSGYVQWTVDGLGACTQSSDQSTPSIISDGSGGVIVAWSDWRSGIERDLYAQRIDANGNLKWAQHGAEISIKIEREHSEKIISDDNGGVIIVWEQQRTSNFTWDIWAQRLDSNGMPVWPVGGIPICFEGSNRKNHKVQRDRKGGAFICWQDERSGSHDIYAQHLDKNGNLLWDPMGLLICDAPNSQTNPKIDPDKSLNGIYICWVDSRGSDYDIYANKVDSVGNVYWGPQGLPVIREIGNQSAVDILSNNKTDGLIICWKDRRNNNWDIYAQRLNEDGLRQWDTSGVIICNLLGSQKNPNIISDTDGGGIIVWQDKRNNNWDIYSQRIRNNGDVAWADHGIPICLADDDQKSPKNVGDGKGGTIVAWEDERNGNSGVDIYVDHLWIYDSTLSVGFNSYATEMQVRLYPNPVIDNIYLTNMHEFSLIEIRNILGQKCEGYHYNKTHSFIDVKDFNSGIYFLDIFYHEKKKTLKFLKQ